MNSPPGRGRPLDARRGAILLGARRGASPRYVFGFQPDNAIPIESWYDDPDDTELEKLKGLLEQLRGAADVKPLLVDAFAMRRRIQEAEADGPAPSPFA